MPQDKTKLHLAPAQPAAEQEESLTAASPLLEQAQGFAQVAREAVKDCERGDEAIKELQRRRNRSGQ